MSATQNNDTAFMASFLGVLAGLVALTLAIILLADFVSTENPISDYQAKKTAARLEPLSTVVTDPKALIKASTATAHKVQTADQIFTAVCSACHVPGMLGAPKVGDKADWSKREKEAGGVDGLVSVAIKGKGSMPPRGGSADLSDAEIKSAIELMLKKTGL